ncbi:MAG: PKD domain protein, partial [Bacteroidia bacterium]|nr:PKD domain protein [Bacteroidia bacterium]
MKTIKYIFGLSLFLIAFMGCEEDDNFDYLNTVVAPTNVSALFQITQDNSGLVKIIPNSEGAVMYNINFGDSSEPEAVEQGKAIEHIYAEGNYVVNIEAIGLTGLKTVASQEMVVSFKAPENVEITIEKDASNPFIINVSAEADYANGFEVYFGDDPDAEPVLLMLG